MVCVRSDPLVQKVCELYDKISKLESLSPSKDVDALFMELVAACIPPHPIDVSILCTKIKLIRNDLILLCGRAEGLMEKHYSTILGSLENPLDHLNLFPYYPNYLKLGKVEFDLLSRHCPTPATRVAFVGSGSLPLTSIVLATHHMRSAVFDNYDIDPSANLMAARLVGTHPDLLGRMEFRTMDIMSASTGTALKEYDVVFLAALVGMGMEEKMRVVGHLAEHMAHGAILMLRSAHGARAFLYPVVEPGDLRGFEVLSVYHPTDDVINSVVVARKSCGAGLVHSGRVGGVAGAGGQLLNIPCSKFKCGEMKMIEEFDHVLDA